MRNKGGCSVGCKLAAESNVMREEWTEEESEERIIANRQRE